MWQCNYGKVKLAQLKQSELPMHEYITKFGNMAEHAYSIKATNSASVIWPLISLRVYKTLMLKQAKVLSGQEPERHIWSCYPEGPKTKDQGTGFGLCPKLETMPNCSINAIRDKGCFKCGSADHFVKDCPLSQPDNMAQKGHYTDCKNANNTNSTTDKVMEPLTRLFTDLVAQLKLLIPSVHGPHGGTPTYDRKGRNGQWQTGSNNGHRHHTNDSYHKREDPNQDHHIDCHHKSSSRHNGHQWSSRNGTGNKNNFSSSQHTRIYEIGYGSECNSECLVMSNLKEHLEEEVAPVPT